MVRFIETESRRVTAKSWGGGDGKLLFNGYRVSGLQEDKVLEMGCTTM